MLESLVAFAAVSAIVIVTPGQDTALTIRNSLLGGRRTGLATALGVAGGQAVWTTATSLGLAALIVASEPVFVALKLVGAAYLVYLGAQSLFAAGRRRHRTHRSAGSAQPRVAFRQGALSNLGNPKIAVFFSGLLPQFGSSFGELLALGLLFLLHDAHVALRLRRRGRSGRATFCVGRPFGGPSTRSRAQSWSRSVYGSRPIAASGGGATPGPREEPGARSDPRRAFPS